MFDMFLLHFVQYVFCIVLLMDSYCQIYVFLLLCICCSAVAYPGIVFGGKGRVQQIRMRTGGREKGDMGAVAP